MRVLYIGQFSEGTTSRMRADTINKILKPEYFDVVDTNIPFFETSHIWRTLGFRLKKGPLINKINNYVLIKLNDIGLIYDLIWVDKGIFLKQEVVEILNRKAEKLVHYTPDMAFFENKSSLFEKSIPYYDFLISTKSKEKGLYLQQVKSDKLIMTTQGFDHNVHKNLTQFKDKKDAVSFIGLCEPHREEILQLLIDKGIKVHLAGKGWKNFVRRNRGNSNIEFYGDGLFSLDYSKFIASTKFGLGLLSKRFPELHTTRTFEIPACGTALLTERNKETILFFNEDEAIFYKDTDELLLKIEYYLNHAYILENLIQKGHDRVILDKYDYDSILREVLNKVLT